MNRFKSLFINALSILCFSSIAYAQLISDVDAIIQEQLFDIEEFLINITNVSDRQVNFRVAHEVIRAPDLIINEHNNRIGPRRDEPGDLLYSFRGPNAVDEYWSPIASDGEIVFIANITNSIVFGYSHNGYEDFQEEFRWNVPSPIDGDWYSGCLYIQSLDENVIRCYDREGENVFNLEPGFEFTGFAIDEKENLIFLRHEDSTIRVHSLLDEGARIGNEIGNIDNYRDYTFDYIPNQLVWVEKHRDGKLWVNNKDRDTLYQIAIVENNWRANGIEQQLSNGDNSSPYDGFTHDGNHLWLGGYNNNDICIYEDGVNEVSWLSYEPKAGALQSEERITIFVMLDATGMLDGEYEAELYITPDQGQRLIIPIYMYIVGTPDIQIVWANQAGYPDVIDYNLLNGDVFSGREYHIPMLFKNEGTDELEVYGIEFNDNNRFIANFDEFILQPQGSRAVTITYFTDLEDFGEHQSTMVVYSNDTDEEEFAISICAISVLEPRIMLDAEEVGDFNLLSNAEADYALGITNSGNLDLEYRIEIEYLDDIEDEYITFSVLEGVVAPLEEVDIDLTINTENLQSGVELFSTIYIFNNDPSMDGDAPYIRLDVSLFVGLRPIVHFTNYTESDSYHQLNIENIYLMDEIAELNQVEIGVFNDLSVLSGSSISTGSNFEMMVYGATELVDQFREGEHFTIRLWDRATNYEYDTEIEWISGPETWTENGSSTLNVRSDYLISIDKDYNAYNIATTFRLYGVYPNPFNNSTLIHYDLPVSSDVKISIYDINGRLISNLVNKMFTAGSYNIPWNANGNAAGVYIIQMQSNGGEKLTQKVVLTK